ncbi:hypothetical protein ACF3NS_14880 [Arsenicicoccus cauae]|uniref:hypothetical protein n=1 Tax=Arsenicicoccus cauae TaxID=2663847 RepID=UPI00370D3715
MGRDGSPCPKRHDTQEHDIWYERRWSQHRAYWRTETGRQYEPFRTEADANAFINACKEHGREVILAILHSTAPDTMAQEYDADASLTAREIQAALVLPPLPERIQVPEPGGMSLRWLGEQYVESGNKRNEQTRGDSLEAEQQALERQRPRAAPMCASLGGTTSRT